jgi:hypothetical protein
MAYLYRHIRLDKNEPFYIGIGSDELRNYKRSKTTQNRNTIWNRIVSKTEYRIDIVLEDLTWDEACKKEIELISLYGKITANNGILANITDGGEGAMGAIRSEETRKRMSDALKGRVHSESAKEKSRQAHLGRKHSEEHRRKISEAGKGRKHTEEAKKRISEAKIGNKHFLGKKHSEEWKKKMSDAFKGQKLTEETKAKIANSLRGKVISKETREKISKSLKGRIFSEEHRKKLSGVANNASKTVLDTQTGIYYDSANDAFKAIVLSFSPRHFRGMLSGRCNNKTTMIYA